MGRMKYVKKSQSGGYGGGYNPNQEGSFFFATPMARRAGQHVTMAQNLAKNINRLVNSGLKDKGVIGKAFRSVGQKGGQIPKKNKQFAYRLPVYKEIDEHLKNLAGYRQMQKQKKMKIRKRGRRSFKQKGGILPLAAAIPALLAVGKVAGLGALSAGAGFGVDALLKKATG